jgi:hypothetical protein
MAPEERNPNSEKNRFHLENCAAYEAASEEAIESVEGHFRGCWEYYQEAIAGPYEHKPVASRQKRALD